MKMRMNTATAPMLAISLALVLVPRWSSAATVTVNILNYSFQPSQVTINVGDTVTWVNQDPVAHTTTSDTGVWDSGFLSPRASFSFKFTQAGSYSYLCTIHTYMTGTVVVQAAADQPPTVAITSPANGAVFTAPLTGTITASASDPDGTVAQVQFFANGALLGTVTQSPFNVSVTNEPAGNYTLTAVATDNGGLMSTSAPVSITVKAPDQPPTVAITSPANGAVFTAPLTGTITASASDPDGTVAQVQFFANGALLGTVTQSPFNVSVTNEPAGNYTLTAVAKDNGGLMSTSAPVNITVTAPAPALNAFLVEKLVSDVPGLAAQTDPNLLNPWGIASTPTSPFWVTDNHAGLSTLYNSTGAVQSLVVTVPPSAGGMPPAAPTGIVFNNSTNFIVVSNTPARFIFATEDGTISAWVSGTNAVLEADRSTANAIYKGLALAANNGTNYLYAADFHNGRIDTFDAKFADVSAGFTFTDPTIPTGFAPFNIQFLNGALYVTYGMQDANKEDDVAGPGLGFVDVFDTAGHLVKRLVSNGPLNAPWGLAIAPAGFGPFGGNLLVGNFGDGQINAFDPDTGAMSGTLLSPQGDPIAFPGLWGLIFGNGGKGGETNSLYFAAGIAAGGSLEDHGLFGRITWLTGTYVTSAQLTPNGLSLNWVGGTPPFTVQKKASLADPSWQAVTTTTNQTAVVPAGTATGFFRISN